MGFHIKRQLTEEEKKEVLRIHGPICYATGHGIVEGDTIQFDHIKAFSEGGESEIINIAPMCETHNKQKGALTLYDFRKKIAIDEFFKEGDALTLKNELEFFKKKKDIERFGEPINIISTKDGIINLEILNEKKEFSLHECPTTGWKYFYALLPVGVLDSDDDADNEIGLQPRYLIKDKVFNMFRHFQNHPVLQPSLCRIYKNRVLVFDGQHKIASMLWGGRHDYECKVYIDPNPSLLNQTNIAAHDKYAQTRFFSSIMVAKLGAQFGKEFEVYRSLEDDIVKTEQGFVDYLKSKDQLTKAEINKRFKSFLYNSVLDDESNKVSSLVSNGNRGTAEKPITMDMLDKSVFTLFFFRNPVDDDMSTSAYKREVEFENVIFYLNELFDKALFNWDSKKPSSDALQGKLNRMFRSKSIIAWTEIVHDAICAKLNIHDRDDQIKLMYNDLSDSEKENISFIVQRLVDWNIWSSPTDSGIDRVLADNKSAVKDFLRDKGLTTGYLMGAKE